MRKILLILCLCLTKTFSADPYDRYADWFDGGEEPASSFSPTYLQQRIQDVGEMQGVLKSRIPFSDKCTSGKKIIGDKFPDLIFEFRSLAREDGFLSTPLFRELLQLCSKCIDLTGKHRSREASRRITAHEKQWSEFLAKVAIDLEKKYKERVPEKDDGNMH